jgi:hypothetical protein
MFAKNVGHLATFLTVALVGFFLTPEVLIGQITQTAPVSAKPAKLPSNWKGDLVEIPSAPDGVILFIGVEIKPGDKGPESEQFSINAGAEERKYRRIAVGDVIEKGQVIGRLDETLARTEERVRQAMVAAAQIHLAAGEKTHKEAENRRLAEEKRWYSPKRISDYSFEEVRGARFTYYASTVGKFK